MKKRQLRTTLIFANLIAISFFLLAELTEEYRFSRHLLETRSNFHKVYAKPEQLLKLWSAGNCVLTLSNTSDEAATVHFSEIFLSRARMIRKIEERAHSKKDIPETILNFIREHSKHRHPLFQGNDLHDPERYLNIFGGGYCDDAATNFVELASNFSIPSRTVWIEGKETKEIVHVVAESFIDEEWRMFDPDIWGVVRDEVGKVIATDSFFALGPKHIAPINEPILRKTLHPNWDQNRSRQTLNSAINFFPNEKKIFFNSVQILSTDGLYPREGWQNPIDLLNHHDQLGNFIRVIPLDSLSQSKVTVFDYFPITGAFLVSYDETPSFGTLEVKLDTDRPELELWAEHDQFRQIDTLNSQGLRVIDLSPALRTLEKSPSYELSLRNIPINTSPTLLITAHIYAKDNLARYTKDLPESINNIKVTRCGTSGP